MFRTTACFICIIAFFSCLVPAQAAADPAALSPGIEHHTGVAITIYNVNLSLIKDTRHIAVPKGTADLRFMDVSAQIIPASVHIRSLSNPASLSILEQNYEYDLLNAHKLLDKYVGKEVSSTRRTPIPRAPFVEVGAMLQAPAGYNQALAKMDQDFVNNVLKEAKANKIATASFTSQISKGAKTSEITIKVK